MRKRLGLTFTPESTPPTVKTIMDMKEIDALNSRSEVKVQPGMTITSVRGGGAGQEADTRGMTPKDMVATLKPFDLPWALTFE